MNNSLLLNILSESIKANQFALDMKGRSFGLKFCTVTDNRDPLGMRRLKVTTESVAGLVSTDWLLRLPIVPNYDPPLPAVGTSVICGFIDSNPHDGLWLGVTCNDTNPADDTQENYIDDSTIRIPGNNKELIGGNDTQTVEGDRTTAIKGDYTHTTDGDENRTVQGEHTHTVNQAESRRTDENLVISCGQSITLKTDSGASLTLAANGAVVLRDAYNHVWTLGGANGSDWVWDLNGATVQIVNAGGITVNGHQVAVVGARDSEGDVLVSRGY